MEGEILQEKRTSIRLENTAWRTDEAAKTMEMTARGQKKLPEEQRRLTRGHGR
jgi:hypothetical protein